MTFPVQPPIPLRTDPSAVYDSKAYALAQWQGQFAAELDEQMPVIENAPLAAAASALEAQQERGLAEEAAAEAAAAALTALGAPGTLATSTTELTIEVGEPNLVIQPGKALRPGMYVTCSAPGGQLMYGRILAYDTDTGDLQLFVLLVDGAGTFSQWSVAVSGPPARIPRNKLFYYGGA